MNLVMFLMNQFGEQAVNFARPAPGQTNPCIFGGEGVPDMDAPENSLYIQLDATGLDGWIYRNTDGEDTWEALGSAADVLGTPLTGFTSGAGTVAATDTIVQGFNKLAGNLQNKAVGANVLTGLVAGSNTAIQATDTLLVALANLQAQIDALA